MLRSLPVVCFLLASLVSCAKKDDPRAPRIAECEGDNCGSGPTSGGHTGGGLPSVGGASSTDDSAAPPSMNDEDGGMQGVPGTLTGDVSMLVGSNLRTVRPLESEVEISALAAGGGRAIARYDGEDDFSLGDVAVVTKLWVGIEQVGVPERPLMRTLQAVNSTSTDIRHLQVVERASLEDIAGQSALLTPVALDETKGHAVIYFVDPDNVPVSGISILPNTAIDGALVAYDAGELYSDALEETEAGGSVLLLNLVADTFPGDEATIAFGHGGLDSSFVLDVARDSVTLLVVQIN